MSEIIQGLTNSLTPLNILSDAEFTDNEELVDVDLSSENIKNGWTWSHTGYINQTEMKLGNNCLKINTKDGIVVRVQKTNIKIGKNKLYTCVLTFKENVKNSLKKISFYTDETIVKKVHETITKDKVVAVVESLTGKLDFIIDLDFGKTIREKSIDLFDLALYEGGFSNPPVRKSIDSQLHSMGFSAGGSTKKSSMYIPGGDSELLAGDANTEGYFGEVSGENLIQGWELLRELVDGDPEVMSDEASFRTAWEGLDICPLSSNLKDNWLKFICDKKIMYVYKSYLAQASWNTIRFKLLTQDFTEGTDVAIEAHKVDPNIPQGVFFNMKCRLLKGGNHNPIYGNASLEDGSKVSAQKLGMGSEWNRLMYKVYSDAITGNETYSGGPEIGDEKWSSFTLAQLGANEPIICQEYDMVAGSNIVIRGGTRMDFISSVSKTAVGRFKPVLIFDPQN